MIQLIIPMSGQGTRFQKEGYVDPKPLIPINGKPIIERLLEKFPIDWPVIFIVCLNHKNTNLPNVLKKIRPNSKIVYIPEHKKGPSFAVKSALNILDPNIPILISYCDYGMTWDPWDFLQFVNNTRCTAALISYRGFHAHYLSETTYAFSRIEGERVVEVKEKGSFTKNRENEFASCGAYYFNNLSTLSDAINYQEINKLELNGEFYTSLTIEAHLRFNPNSNVRIYEIPFFFQWGTPQDLQIYEYWERTIRSTFDSINQKIFVDQIQIPMAGFGSRFRNIYKTAKPYLIIDQKMMYKRAIQSLPKSDNINIVTVKTKETNNLDLSNFNYTYLDKTPQGQAFTVKEGLDSLKSNGDLIISSCDHSIYLNENLWNQFRELPDCDAAIFTIKGFPGVIRNPLAYAYVESESSEDVFNKISSVSVKKPISSSPQRDDLLVGTFWFKNKLILERYLNILIEMNVRINGEIYLDSIFNLMIQDNKIVRKIDLKGYINWGDPDSLAEAIYWQEAFGGHRYSIRSRYPGVVEL